MKKSKGVLTLEAALIMPLVIYIVILMIFMTLFIYTKIHVSLTTNFVVNHATSGWYNLDSEFGSESKKDYGVIANAIGTASSKDTKKQVIENSIRNGIENGAPVPVRISEFKVKPTNYIVGEKLDISIKCDYKIPLVGLLRLFGIASHDGIVSDTYNKTVMLSDTESNMRTISYVADLLSRVKDDVMAIVKDMKDKLSGVVN